MLADRFVTLILVMARRGLFLSCAIAAVSSYYYFASVSLRHTQYDTYAFDLGLLTQVTWNTLNGRWFETTVLPFNYLAEHLSPALVLAAPLLLIWPSAVALLGLQSFAIALAGVGVYLVAQGRSGDPWAALLVQLAYSIVPATGWMAIDEFHPITLAMPALTFATWYLWRRRLAKAAFVGGLALLANEDAALVVAPFGALLALVAVGRGRLWGVVLATLAVAWLGLYLFVIVPAVRPPELASTLSHPDLRHYLQCGSGLPDIVRCLLDPSEVSRRVSTPGDLAAMASLLLPTLGFAAVGPSFLVAVPRWLALLLGNDPPPFQLHYAALLVTAAYLAVGESLRFVAGVHSVGPRVVSGAVASAAVIAFVLGGPLPGGGAFRSPMEQTVQRNKLLDKVVALVPSEPAITVAATSNLLPHFAVRSVVVFPVASKCPDPDVYAVDLRDGYPYTESVLRRTFERVRADPAYVEIFSQDEVVVLRWAGASNVLPRYDGFAEIVQLEGLRYVSGPTPLAIELQWRKQGPAWADYHYFVHLVDAGGMIFSQADGQLLGAHLGSFIDGCRVRETVNLPTPPMGEWTAHRLRVGWYDFATGARLPLPNGSDYAEIELTAILPRL